MWNAPITKLSASRKYHAKGKGSYRFGILGCASLPFNPGAINSRAAEEVIDRAGFHSYV
jgi:hypothetical protein